MASIIDRNTKNLMTAKLQKELSALFAEQESSKRPRYNMRPLKAARGLTVGGPEDPSLAYSAPGIQDLGFGPVDMGSLNNWQNSNVGFSDDRDNPNMPNFKSGANNNWLNGKLGDIMPSLATLAPVFSNMIGGLKPAQQLNARDYYNPNRNKIMSLMANRRTNIQPQLDAVLSSERTGQYNLRNTANSRGELMGNLTGLQNNAMRNRASIYANKQNMDLGYQGQEAEMLNSLGAGEQQANWNTMDYNNQNIANKRNMWRAGLSQLSQYSQSKDLMKNQMTQDQNKLAALKDMFASIAPFMKSLQDMQFSKN